jgi:SNF2 family DNA or RNA helicase
MSIEKNYYPLLIPNELQNGVPFVKILYVEKDKNGTKFQTQELSKLHFKYYSNNIGRALSPFLEDHFFELLLELKRQHAKSKSGVSQDVYLKRAVFRSLAEQTESMFKLMMGEKVFCRTVQPNGDFLTSSCQFSLESPALSFEVIESEEGGLLLEAIFTINGQIFTKNEMKIYSFLLNVEKTFYIISQKDYHTLEWLNEKKPRKYAQNSSELMQKIILPLEEKSPVNRNNLFEISEINITPQSAVLLSEISGSFLMLTPRWNYDGFIVEGNFQEFYDTNVNGKLYRIHRNQTAEQDFFNYLKKLHPLFSKQLNGYFYLSFEEAKKKQWFLKTFHQWLDDDVEIHGMDLLHHFRYSPFEIYTDFKVLDQKGAILQLYLKVSFGKEEAPLNELKKLLISGQSSVLLKDNSIGVLTDEWIQNYGTIIKHGQIHKNIITIPQWIILALQSGSTSEQLSPVISKDWWNKWQNWQDENSRVYDLPAGINAELRPYQHKGFEWMVLLSEIGAGALLADDMGLGKTLQTIAFLTYQFEINPAARFLIVCPASLMYNWSQEIQKFSPNLACYNYHSGSRDLQKFQDSKAQILICSYGTMRADVDELSVRIWDAIVLDESHHVRNYNTLVSKSIQYLNSSSKIALSGTPVMNNTEDLFPQLNFLLPGFLGTNEFFRKEYALPIDRNRDPKKIENLQKLTNPFVLRRTKQQVAADLPEKTESIYWCEMSIEQKECYEEVKNSVKSSLFLGANHDTLVKNKLSILQGIQKLRQICASPSLVKGFDFASNSSIKLDLIMEEIHQLGNHKALIFSQFKGMLQLIVDKCQRDGIFYYHIDGDTPIAERQNLVNSFQEEGNPCQVFLISLMTGNAGLNLTAADYVFLIDPWWNTAIQQQAIDRTHRIGQNKNVFAYKMICKDTIEEKILMLQQKKKELSEGLVHEEDGFVKQLTEKDIEFLFE